MKFASLGSGSSGNATLVSDGIDTLLVDCGFTIKETVSRLARLNLKPEDISAILVTHEHSDHMKGVGPLARKFSLPVYMTQGTHVSRDYGRLPEINIIHNYQDFSIGQIQISPVAVPHDAREPSQFVLSAGGISLGILTDLGSITPHVTEAYSECDGLLIEANHDLDMLARGPYPQSLKSRVASNWGHLNNMQTRHFLESIDLSHVQHIVIGHISSKNNSVDVVQSEISDVLAASPSVHYALQDSGFDWLELEVGVTGCR